MNIRMIFFSWALLFGFSTEFVYSIEQLSVYGLTLNDLSTDEQQGLLIEILGDGSAFDVLSIEEIEIFLPGIESYPFPRGLCLPKVELKHFYGEVLRDMPDALRLYEQRGLALIRHYFALTQEYFCKWNDCTSSFNNDQLFYDHVESVHLKDLPSKGKKHRCKWIGCKHAASTKGNLKTHLRLHTGESPYKCNRCDESYVQQSLLHLHQKSCK